MKITEKDIVKIHGFSDWIPSVEEWNEMMDTVLIGASQECDATVNGITKTMKEWQDTN